MRSLAALLLPPVALLLAPTLAAQEDERKDQPHFSRMPNFFIESGEDRDFDAYSFWDGKAMKSIEGRKWVRHYRLKDGATPSSALQISRNYANALKAANGVVCFQGIAEGSKFGEVEGRPILSGRMTKGGREVWLLIANFENTYSLYCVQTEAMKQEVSAKEMMDALRKDGFIALDIHFATGNATIQPESRGIVDQIAELLKQDATLKVSIEGHTDNTGTPAGNKKLSEDRAKSVTVAVVSKGIPATRMSAIGWGQEKPVADNRTEEGRAKNRRVEIVKK